MGLLNRSNCRPKCILRDFVSSAGCSQDFVELFTELTRSPCNERARCPWKPMQAFGRRGIDESSLFSKPDQAVISRQVFDRLVRWTLIQRVHEVERGMAPTPVK